jgi:hypothetical protein
VSSAAHLAAVEAAAERDHEDRAVRAERERLEADFRGGGLTSIKVQGEILQTLGNTSAAKGTAIATHSNHDKNGRRNIFPFALLQARRSWL